MTLALLCKFTAQHVSDVNTPIFSSGSAYTRTPHHQQTIPLRNTSTPQISLHNNATSSRKLLKMDVLTSETCWAVNWHNKASVIKLVYLYSNIKMMHGPIRIKYSFALKSYICISILLPMYFQLLIQTSRLCTAVRCPFYIYIQACDRTLQLLILRHSPNSLVTAPTFGCMFKDLPY